MNFKKKLTGGLCCLFLGLMVRAQTGQPAITLQQLLNNMQSTYELLKYENSMVQSKQAQKKAVTYDRLPHLNAMYEADLGSDNNIQGSYFTMGLIPSTTGGRRQTNNLSAVSGQTALGGLDWQITNFGGYKANENLAKSDLQLQINKLGKTQYDLEGIASAYYLELIRQYELQLIQQQDVDRLRQLKGSIDALVTSGTRPGVDSMIATSELSKSLVGLYEANKNYAQMQVQLSTLTGLLAAQLKPDTTAETRLINDGVAYTLSSSVDTLHHPDITLYSSFYDYAQAKLKQQKNSYYPKLFLNADAWARGASLNNSDQYNDLSQGFTTSRFNYLAGLTITYDVFSLVHRKLNSSVSRFESEAAYHQLQNEKTNLNSAIQQATIEKDFELSRLTETGHQLSSASSAYEQQLSLYKSGLSSIIELNTASNYYIEARKAYVNAKIGLMRSVINYSLVTNSFSALVQNLKL